MFTGMLVDAVLSGVLGGDRKQSRRAQRFLTGRGGGLWSNPATLLTAAGVAWGVYQTLQKSGSGPAPEGGAGPDRAAKQPSADPPPLPVVSNPDGEAGTSTGDTALRLVRLAISAASADGALNDRERAAILQQARAAGIAEDAERELNQPRPVGEIVSGVTDAAEAATLYVLAFTILRADEQVTATERIYLAQLANLLGLSRETVEALEKDTGERIDALGDQGQPGG